MNTCSLLITDLRFYVNLGWPDDERDEKQCVSLDIDIRFPKIPKACHSGDLNDTLCYKWLVEELLKKISQNHYTLVENLTYDIFQIIKSLIPEKSMLKVHLTKKPRIENLHGSIRFSYSDEIAS